MPLPAGSKLGPFDVVSPLGEGGMGEVYRALDTRLGREVALKVLPAEVASDVTRLTRFASEARAASALNHPNIVTIYEVGQAGKQPFIAMELIDGATLRTISAGGAMPVRKVLTIASQVADALAKAHAAGIVHRDLKPENVMVTKDGYVKLLDFGLAKLIGAGDGHAMIASLTGTGLVVGTADYMSPEQASGSEIDFRSDQFALGLILYELVTGRKPFLRASTVQTLTAIIQDDPEPIETLNPRAPAPLCWLIDRLLSKDREERYSSTQDLARELRMLRDRLAGVASEPVESRADLVAQHRARSSRLTAGRPITLPKSAQHPAVKLGVPLLLSLILFAAGVLGGVWYSQLGAPPARFTGEVLLGASTRVFAPLVSPDGQTLAFLTLENGVAQVAVMKPGSGDWAVLTKHRELGSVNRLSWSRDGTRIYYDRVTDAPRGVYTIPVLGGDERLVLPEAQGPEVLPDGSLLVQRIDAGRNFQLHRFWPEGGRLTAVGPAIARESAGVPLRAFPDGKEAIIFGKLAGRADAQGLRFPYVLDLERGQTRRFAPDLPLGPPFTISGDGKSVVADLVTGDLHNLVEVSRSGDSVRTLLALPARPWYVSAAPDGSLYVGIVDNPIELLRFPAAGGSPERLAAGSGRFFVNPVQFPDGRVLLPGFIAGRRRLLIGAPGEAMRPFLTTPEQSAPPVTLVGRDHIAFVGADSASQLPVLALASISEGRVVRRFEETKGVAPIALAATPDGSLLYYVESGWIWALDPATGRARKLRAGNGVAADPKGGLLVQLNEKDGVRLVRVGPDGLETALSVPREARLAASPIAPNAIGADGRIVVSVSSAESFFTRPAILDPADGSLTRVPVQYDGDVAPTGWGDGGLLLAVGTNLKSELWRFRPVAAAR